MKEPSSFLSSLNKTEMSDDELNVYVNLLANVKSKNEQINAVEHLLRVIELTPNQIIGLLENEPVKNSIALKYPIKKYVSIRHYKEAEQKSENESLWMTALLHMGSI